MKRHLATSLALAVLSATAVGQCDQPILAPPGPGASSAFGAAIAATDKFVVVGDWYASHGPTESGAATVFTRASGGAWWPQTTIVPSDVASKDEFGRAVAASGDRIAVGSPYADGAHSESGAVYVFHRFASSWVLDAKLQNDSTWLGRSLALEGDRLVVGAQERAFVFEHGAAGWTQTAELQVDATDDPDSFGMHVALDDNTVVVADRHWEPAGANESANRGAAFVFEHDGGAWQLAQRLEGVKSGDWFGSSVDVDAGRVLVGAMHANGQPGFGGTSSGAAYVYADGAAGWVLERKLWSQGGSPGDQFGRSVALEGEWALVGAPYADEPLSQTGAGYAFERVGGTWPQRYALEADPPGFSDQYGHFVTLHGGLALLGGIGPVVRSWLLDDGAALFACPPEVSLASGGRQDLTLRADVGTQAYLVLGSASGTAPGVAVDGLVLPLVVDRYLLATLVEPNAGPFDDTFGALDATGFATAGIDVPAGLDPSLAGVTLHHAFVAFSGGGVTFASNAAPLTLRP